MVERKHAGELLSEMVQIVRAFRSSGQRSRERSLTGTKIGVLQHLRDGDARLGEVAGVLAVSAPVASRAVDSLECDDLVQRRRDALDARALLISITETGRDALREREAYIVDRFTEALRDWSDEDAAQAVTTLQRLNVHLAEVLAGLESPQQGPGVSGVLVESETTR